MPRVLDLGRLSLDDLSLVQEFVELLQDRPVFPSSMPAERKGHDSSLHMIAMLDLAHRASGDEVVRQAYGEPQDSREGGLRELVRRIEIVRYAFGGHDRGRGSLLEVAGEARAVAQGDVPRTFAKLGARKKTIRLLQAKFRALRWDAWLEGFQISTLVRREVISAAFISEWDTIARRWKDDVRLAWGDEALSRLKRDRADAEAGFRLDGHRKSESWEQALNRDGRRYRAQLAQR